MALRPFRSKSRPDQKAEKQAAEQDVLLREVDDALRQDEMLGAARRYGRVVAVAVGGGLLALAGVLWWSHSRSEERASHAEKMTLALDRLEAGNLDAASKELAPLVADGKDGSAAVAKLTQGAIALQQDKRQEALKLFAEVSEDDAAPKPLRDLATVRQVAAGFDAMTPGAVVSRLKPLAVPGSPWFGSAGELLGMAYLKQGRADLAGPLFAAISRDEETPESLRRRARQMAGVLGVDAIDDVARAAADGAAAPGPAGAAPQLVQ